MMRCRLLLRLHSTVHHHHVGRGLLRKGDASLSLDAKAALDAYGEARKALHAEHDVAGEAEAILGQARALRAQGLFEAMVSHLKEYLKLMGDKEDNHENLAWISYELGYHGYELGDFSSSLRFMQAARMNANLAGNKKVEADSLVYLGALYARREPQRGLQLMQRGLNIMIDSKDEVGQRKVLLMMGRIQHTEKQYDDAISSYSAATILARKVNDIKGEAGIYRQAGMVLKDKGEMRSALLSFRVAIKLSDQCGDKLGLVSSARLTGNVLDEISPGTPEAVTYWKLALRGCRELDPNMKKSIPLASEVLYRLIQHYETQRLFLVALPYRQELTQMMKEAGLARGHGVALLDTATLLARLGQVDEAATAFTQAAQLWKEHADPVNEATARVGCARARFVQGNIHEARVEARQARDLLAQVGGKRVNIVQAAARLRALAAVAEVLVRVGDVSEGEEMAQAAMRAAASSPVPDAEVLCVAQMALVRACSVSRPEEALKNANAAMGLAIKEHHQQNINMGLELLGELHLAQGHFDKAEKYFEKLVAQPETRVLALQALAMVAERRGSLKLAIKLHMDCVADSAKQPFVAFKSLNALVELHRRMGNESQALAYQTMCANWAKENRGVSSKQ